jgi:hypothetical protein
VHQIVLLAQIQVLVYHVIQQYIILKCLKMEHCAYVKIIFNLYLLIYLLDNWPKPHKYFQKGEILYLGTIVWTTLLTYIIQLV